ncbi:MAG: hypothetical protein PHQ35_10710, partial [Phycisphaerae bacterium]|nr:hypothetical protein [Phycisphaerae bacterium]
MSGFNDRINKGRLTVPLINIIMLFKKKLKFNIASLGVVEDPRTDEEKKKDYKESEIACAPTPFIWKEKPEAEWRKFPILFQDSSSSCVAQAVAKALGIENFIEEGKFVNYSARDIYTRRANYPDEGMWFQNAMDIGHNIGSTFEQLMPSQGLSETMMNISSDRTPLCEIAGKIGRGGNYISLPIDIDSIASIVESQGKGVVLGVRFGPNEWFGKKVPEVLGNDKRWGHGTCVTNATLYNGKKALVIEDSAYYDANKESIRIITEDWFKAGRITFAGYYSYLRNDGLDNKPSYNFARDLEYGMESDPDVVKLQECLAYLKFFPSGQSFTGNFFGITLKAVKLFQEA